MTIIDQRFFKSNVSGFINLPLNGNTTLTLESNISALAPADTKNYRIVFRADSPEGDIIATSNVITMYGNAFLTIQATGGTKTAEGDWIVHAFTSSDNFDITSLSIFAERNTIQYLTVGGGGAPSPSTYSTAGGGAGGLLQGNISVTSDYISNTQVIVGAAGAGGALAAPTILFNSTPRQITAFGGGNGRADGGSGGGGQVFAVPGNTPGRSGVSGQGNPGGGGGGSNSPNNPGPSGPWRQTTYSAGGGGGAGDAGGPVPGVNTSLGRAGNGLAVSWIPASYGAPGPTPGRWFAAGAGGSGYNYRSPTAPGGGSTSYPSNPNGAGYGPANGSASQSGVVILRYPKG